MLQTMDKNFVNVVLLGFAFMLIFTAFSTGSMIQQTVVNSIKEEDPSYNAEGYVSLSILYLVYAVANWIAPSALIVMGPKFAMVLGAVSYCLFISNFLYPLAWLLYLLSAVMGVGAALLWTGQGIFLTIKSNSETMSRNSGVFWALYQSSLLFGNLFVFFMFHDNDISKPTRMWTYGVLTSVSVIGVCMLLTLRGGTQQNNNSDKNANFVVTSPLQAFVNSVRLLLTPKMSLLCITSFYIGLEHTMVTGVYGTAIGNTNNLDSDSNSKRFIGISGMLIGCGEIIGGAVFGILGSKTNRYGRDLIVILGFLTHMLAFFLIFLNLPNVAAHQRTNDTAYITSSLGIAMLSSVLLGLGDACFNTQMFSLLGVIYARDSGPAFALFNFLKSLATAIGFYYTTVADLHIQCLILVLFVSISTIAFSTVEWWTYEEKKNSEKCSTAPIENKK